MERDIINYKGIRFIRYPQSKNRSERVYYSGWAVINGVKKKVRYHVYKYLTEVGEIPDGYHIHHIDENTLNNEISNYECKHSSDHALDHMTIERRTISKKTIEIARVHSKEWHSSKEGVNWHKAHAKNSLFGSERSCVCQDCGQQFTTTVKDVKKSKFCSKKCQWKSSARRNRNKPTAKDARVCVICNSAFTCFKYNKTKTCSRACSGRLQSQNKNVSA